MSFAELLDHARLCGWALARAIAKAGGAAEISGYLGDSDRFDEAGEKAGCTCANFET